MKNSDLPIGFTPVPNKRIDAAIAAIALKLMVAGAHPTHVHREATRAVAHTLPFPAHRRSYRTPKPSKSDSAVYRKQACPAALA